MQKHSYDNTISTIIEPVRKISDESMREILSQYCFNRREKVELIRVSNGTDYKNPNIIFPRNWKKSNRAFIGILTQEQDKNDFDNFNERYICKMDIMQIATNLGIYELHTNCNNVFEFINITDGKNE